MRVSSFAVRALFLAMTVLSLAFHAGCGGDVPRGRVSGKVTLNNRPLTAGQVLIIGDNKRSGSAVIQPDGTYTIPDAPVGPAVVTVLPPVVPARPPIYIPERYKKPETSDLKYIVTRGTQTYDIPLTP
jgi:hypothetical protein